MKRITKIVALLMCITMLLGVGVYISAEDTQVTKTNDDQIVVAYFNASAYPGQKDFTNIDVLN